jgi:PAS domain S-box-containing protein
MSSSSPLPTPDPAPGAIAPVPDLAALLAALVSSSDDAIIVKSLQGIVLSWNDAAERIFGYRAEEIVGRPLALLAPPERIDEMPDIIAKIRRGERVEHFETQRMRKDGQRIHVSLSVSPIRDAAGEIIAAAKIARDITARKLAEIERAKQHQIVATTNEELATTQEELLSQNEVLLRTQLAVELERSRYQELFELAPDGYVVTDLEGNIVEINRAAAMQLGVAPEKVAGRPLVRHIATPGRRAYRASLKQLAGRGGLENLELTLVSAAGSPFDAALTVATVRDAGGQPSGLRWLIRNVTERRTAERERALLLAKEQAERARAEAAEQRAAFLAEASGILAASLDVEATLESLARLTVPRLADFCLLYEQDEAGGELRQLAAAHADPEREPLLRRLGEVYRVELASPTSVIALAMRSGEAQLRNGIEDDDSRRVLPPGEALDIALEIGNRSGLVVPLSARGRAIGAMVLGFSTSGRRFGEAEVALAGELGRRAAAALDNARLYREARQASAAKDQFIATLSHELRTPLTPVLALVSSLERDPRLPEDVARAIARIRRNVELEAKLIDDLLDLTRVARGKLELRREVADLAQILEHAIDTCCSGDRPDQPEVALDLAPVDYRLWGDGPRLTQVFWNLLHNACKFTPPDGRVTVRSRREEGPGGPALVVEVADTGMGIEPEALPTIFDAFEQGRRAIPRRYGGLGLGLAVSKAIVEMHGGSIAAASAGQGRGATFTVRLPIGELPAVTAPAGAAAGAAEPSARSLHILLVEDHLDTAEVMAELLRGFGHLVTPAHGTGEALTAAEAAFAGGNGLGPIDLVISDLGLPDGSGLDLMRTLSQRWGVKGIALSGYGMDEDRARSREAGFARHLTKPVDLSTLLAAIQEGGA